MSEFFEKVGTEVSPSNKATASLPEPSLQGVPAAQIGAFVENAERRWSYNDDVFWAATPTRETLPAGVYRTLMLDNIGPALKTMPLILDNLIHLPDASFTDILAEFSRFWDLRLEFSKRGFLHKRGFLLWGPPGSGKTSLLQLMMQAIVRDLSGVVLYVDHPHIAAQCAAKARKVEPERPVIVVMEDIDALVQTYGESGYLSLLDGEERVDNVIFLGTTNYPERLDPRFVDRPSRFDTICKIGMPSATAREVYFRAKETTLTGHELALWVRLSDGFSIAHLKEMIIANRCFGQPIEDAVARLQEMHLRPPKSSDHRALAGFANGIAKSQGMNKAG
jgi:energy-coupling factor transporter ATP-binding protein EcfA2